MFISYAYYLLVIIGATEHGEKELVGIYSGYRESTESWANLLRDLNAVYVIVLLNGGKTAFDMNAFTREKSLSNVGFVGNVFL